MKERIKRIYAKYGKYIKYVLIALIALSALFVLWGGAAWLILKDVSSQIDAQSEYALTLQYQSKYGTATSSYYNTFAEANGADKIKVTIAGKDYNVTGTWTFTKDGVSKTIEEWIDEKVLANASTGTLTPIEWTGTAVFEADIPSAVKLFWGSGDKKTFTFNNVTLKLPQLKAVAKKGNTLYATIDAAFASGSGTIYALTAGNGLAEAQKAKTLTLDIASNQTLIVCYDDNYSSYKNNVYTLTDSKAETLTCTNRIYIGNTIQNYGVINVAAIVTDRQGSARTEKNSYGHNKGTSRVCGNHAMIECLNGSTIESTGTINCYGYIQGDVNLNGGTMNVLFSFMDHRGGSAFSGLKGKCFPIRRYYVAAVHGNLTVNYGATLIGTAYIYIRNEFSDDVTFVGSTGSAFVQLKQGSSATIRYTADKASADYGKNKVDIYGSAYLNDITVSVQYLVTITMSTTDGAVPIPYLWEIELHSNGPNTVVDTGNTKMALYPGSKCTVGPGVTLKANDISVYTAAHCEWLATNDTNAVYGTFPDAQLIVNGTLDAKKLGGPITTQAVGAKVIYTANTVTTKEPTSTSAVGDVSHTLSFDVFTANTPTVESKTQPAVGTYNSASYATDAYAWYPTGNVSVTLDANGGFFDNDQSVTQKSHTVSAGDTISGFGEPSRYGYTFSHWCTTSEACTHTKNAYDAVYVSGDTLYAKWTERTYNITFKYVVNGKLQNSYTNVPAALSFKASELSSLILSDIINGYAYSDTTGSAYNCIGFYPNTNSSGMLPNSIALTLADCDRVATAGSVIYVYWTSSEYTVTFNLGNVPDSYGFGTTTEIVVDKVPMGFNPTELSALEDIYTKSADTTNTHLQYIEGWYYDQGHTQPYDSDHDPGENYPLYAKWANKLHVTFGNGTNAPNNFTVLGDTTEIWVRPETTVQLSKYFKKLTDANSKSDVAKYFVGWSNGVDGNDMSATATVTAAMTITPVWDDKFVITFVDGSTTIATYYGLTGQTVKAPEALADKWSVALTSTPDSSVLTEFAHWSDGTDFPLGAGGTYMVAESDITLQAVWETPVTYYKVSVGALTNATIPSCTASTLIDTSGTSVVSLSANTTYYAPAGSSFSITVEYGKTDEQSMTVTKGNTSNYGSKTEIADSKQTWQPPTETGLDGAISITATCKDPTCFTTGTLITLADGTQKKVEDLAYSDMLLVWDFFKGEYTAVPAAVIVFHGNDYYNVVTLTFSDGTEIRIIGSHEFFDVTANAFVAINQNNVASFIGREFIKADGNGHSTVTLVDYSIVNEYTGSYSVLSVFHINCIANGMLSLTPTPIPSCDEFFKYFEVGENLKYDEAQMQADIEKYGLYTYEDFAEYATYEQFVALNAQYYKILVGKGLLTYEEILYAVNVFVHPYA